MLPMQRSKSFILIVRSTVVIYNINVTQNNSSHKESLSMEYLAQAVKDKVCEMFTLYNFVVPKRPFCRLDTNKQKHKSYVRGSNE